MLAYLFEMLHVGHIFAILVLDVVVEHLVNVFVVVFSRIQLLLLFPQQITQHFAHFQTTVWYFLPRDLFENARALTALLPVRLLHHQIILILASHLIFEVVAVVLRSHRAVPLLNGLIH